MVKLTVFVKNGIMNGIHYKLILFFIKEYKEQLLYNIV